MHVWALWLSCGTPAAPPDRAAGARTRQPENSKRARFKAPALQTPPKFHEKTPRERKKKENCGGRREKKARNFGPPTLLGSTLLGPTLRGPTLLGSTLLGSTLLGSTLLGSTLLGSTPPFWAPPFGAPPFGAPPFGAPPFGAPPFGAPPFGAPPFGAPPFGAPPFGAPLLLSLGLHPSGGPTFCRPKIQHPKIGRSRNWPKSKLAEVDHPLPDAQQSPVAARRGSSRMDRARGSATSSVALRFARSPSTVSSMATCASPAATAFSLGIPQ